MFFTILPVSDSDFRKSRILSIFNRIVCILSAMFVAWCFLYCIASFKGAIDDMRKFGGLGFSYPLQHYLATNDFWKDVTLLVGVTAEFLLYVFQCRRADQNSSSWVSIGYFGIMLLSHTGLWLYLRLLLKGYIVESPLGTILSGCRMYVYFSLVFSFAYFILYHLRFYKQKASET